MPAVNHTKLRIPMLSMFTTELMEKSTCTLVWKTRVFKLGLLFFPWVWMVFQKWHKIFLALPRAVARFFCNGGYYRECGRHEPCRGVWGYPPPENFQIRRLQNAIFSTCHEICLRKIDLEDENGKQLQITIIKITESKENKSIQRLDLSGSTSPEGGSCPTALLPRWTD